MTSQRGGFFLGMIVGLLMGLALALGVALYITKVPLPFIDKVPQRTAEQDKAEAEHNKNWDPNSPLYGKNPAKPRPVQVEAAPAGPDAASSAESESPVAPGTAEPGHSASDAKAAKAAAKAEKDKADKAAEKADKADKADHPADKASEKSADKPSRNPGAILSGEPVSSAASAPALTYQVQAGSYASQPEAETQRAKLSMMGLEPRIQEREVNGRTMYRVRIGPYTQREQADEVRARLQGAGIDSALVRIQQK
jgi:cell division protein FtsN